jgi:O-antigen ligase
MPIFCGFGDIAATIVALIEFCILLYYINTVRFWTLLPVFYIYYSQLKIFGFVFFNIYIALSAFKLLVLDRFKLKNSFIYGVLALVIYAGFVLIANDEIWAGFLFLIQSVVSLFVLLHIKQDEYIYRELKAVLVAISISAMLYGVFFQNIKGSYDEVDSLIQYSGRYAGTMSDPNYMAFFYCLSFATVVFAEFKYSLLKWLLAIILFVAIAITGSITALLTYAVVLLLYVLFAKERSIARKAFGVGLIIFGVALFIWYLQTDLESIPILNMFKGRLLEKIQYWIADDLDAFTTGRTEYSQRYIDYLFQQNIFRILFGGYQLNALGLSGAAFESIKFAAHNTYVDVLMTSGVAGIVLFVAILLKNIVEKVTAWRMDRGSGKLSDIVYSVISIVFIAGLSVFPGVNYMFFLFL